MMPDCQDLDLRPAPAADAAKVSPDADAEIAKLEASAAEGIAPSATSTPTPRRRLGPKAILLAGVAGACVLGMGLGLWARPAMNERRIAVAAPEPEAPPADPSARSLKIVVDDGPAAQVGAPIETLRPASKPLFATLRPRQNGQAVMGQVPELTRLEPKAAPKLQLPHLEAPHIAAPKLPELAPLMVAALAAPGHWLEKLKPTEAHPVETASAAPAAAPHRASHQIQLAAADRAAQAAEAQAAADAARAARQADARAEARREALAEQQAQLQQAKLAQAKAEQARLQQAKLEQTRADRAERLREARAQQAETTKLAQAEAKGRAEARAETKAMVLAEARDEAKKRQRLEALVHAVQKVLPHGQSQSSTETARQDRKAKTRHQDPVVERASLKAKRGPHTVEPPNRTHPVQLAPAEPSGLVKVSTPRCASHDPGAALVCADPALGAADRQMSRAYQGARAAGVPEAQLQAQQERWLAARSAAAREAPWAMRDVYLARIAELNSQARDAHGDGY